MSGGAARNEVVVSQISPGPDFDQDQGDTTGVFQRVGLAKRDKEGLAFAEELRLAIPCYACSALNHCPMFCAVEVVAGWQGTTRCDLVASDLVAVAGIKPRAGGFVCAW